MADTPTIYWQGLSGKKYLYYILPLDFCFADEPGNYIFAKETKPNTYSPIYIGETGSLSDRIPNHEQWPCAKRHGATHIHAHKSSDSDDIRRAEEADLIARWEPPCND